MDAIIAVLSRKDGLPAWVIGLIGTVVGAILGFVSSISFAALTERRTKRRMLRLLYREMAKNYWQLVLLNDRLHVIPGARLIKDESEDVLEFIGYHYAKSRPDTFQELTGFENIESVYEVYLRTKTRNANPTQVTLILRAAIHSFESKVATGAFEKALLREVCPKSVKDRIEELSNGRRKPILEPNQSGEEQKD